MGLSVPRWRQFCTRSLVLMSYSDRRQSKSVRRDAYRYFSRHYCIVTASVHSPGWQNSAVSHVHYLFKRPSYPIGRRYVTCGTSTVFDCYKTGNDCTSPSVMRISFDPVIPSSCCSVLIHDPKRGPRKFFFTGKRGEKKKSQPTTQVVH